MRNWADVSDELLDFILSKLFAKDRHSFSLVCRSWNKVAITSPYRYSPCLMYYHRSKHMWEFFQYNSFFYMSFPELENAEIRCSQYGWLLMSGHDNRLFFFDPFNNLKIKLPCKLRFHYTKVCFFHPPTSPKCIVLGISTPEGTEDVNIGVLRRGQNQWDYNRYDREKIPFLVSHASPVLHHGLLYFLGVQGDVATFDLNESCWFVHLNCLTQPSSQIKEHFLFKVAGEEAALFAVFVINDERNVKMFKLLEPEMKWELLEDIGDKVLYLSHASSFGYTTNLKNRIYFPKFHGDSAVFYSLFTGKYHSLDDNYTSDNAYGLKRFDFAVWITPAPTTPVELTTEMTW